MKRRLLRLLGWLLIAAGGAWFAHLNGLPDFIDDLVTTLRNPSEAWPAIESAQGHGRHRMRAGIDIDRAEFSKIVNPHVSMLGDAKLVVEDARALFERTGIAQRAGRGVPVGMRAAHRFRHDVVDHVERRDLRRN